MDERNDILYQVWTNVVETNTELGFDITVTMSDGHSSKKKLSGGFMKMWVPSPLSSGNRIFLFFVCIYSRTSTITSGVIC